ncbi:Uncharacterized protein TCM_003699 [Theobroma cacao]|uniref:Retrotransposon gag domain-containing protein n=1 Tax=Theobroma cacao TaxID=3641 RepID=A0A061DN53_THECC|nr:Uncharacterized protein TCM_003699 [Theobroma cacao]
MERVFEFKDIPDEKCVKLVAIKLKKHASIWWENLKRQQEREGRNKIKIWDKIRQELKQAFVVYHNLNTTMMIVDESSLCHNLFYIRCISQGKVCNVIINSGSCENVVANYMVEKLKLPTKVHLHPYKLQWLRKGNEVKVMKHCCVQFYIGNKYQDEIWCDVIPMDACHLFLGRPCQYDCQAHHDGYKNTYSFIKDGVKIMLTPLKLKDRPKRQEEDKAFITMSGLNKAYHESSLLCLLLVCEKNEVSSPLSKDVKSII